MTVDRPIYVTTGRTESGDNIPALLWNHEPSENEINQAYAPLLEEEFEAFGEDGGLLVDTSLGQWA